MNRAGSWMVRENNYERSRSLWYGACEEGAWVVKFPQLCGLRGHVWLIVLLKWLRSVWMWNV